MSPCIITADKVTKRLKTNDHKSEHDNYFNCFRLYTIIKTFIIKQYINYTMETEHCCRTTSILYHLPGVQTLFSEE